MKILMVQRGYHRGGATQQARTLHDALNATLGFQSYFAYGIGPKADSEEAVRLAWQPELYLHAILTRCLGLQGYGSWFSTIRLVRFIHKYKPDIIHLHNLHGYYLNLNLTKSLDKLGIPVVWTWHDCWPITGRCFYSFECNRWKTGCGGCPDKLRGPQTCLDSSALMWKRKRKYFTGEWKPVIVCPTCWLANKAKESDFRKYRIEIIPTGVDTQIFRPGYRIVTRRQLKISEDEKVILFAAVDLGDERKGAKYFFEALKYIETSNWIVLTIGKKIDLPKEIEVLGDIRQLGYVSNREEVSRIYSAADIFCIPSLEDNFPTTVLESLACATPVVGFRSGGIPEQVTKDCGIIVPSKDARSLGKAITKLLQNDALRQKMSEDCRNRALIHYSIEKFRDGYIELYDELLVDTKR